MINFNFDVITGAILLGAAPSTADDVDELADRGVRAVLNLQTDADLSYHAIHWPTLAASYRSRGIRAVRHPVTDFDRAALLEHLPGCVADLHALVTGVGLAYVHCNVGVNRSPTTVIAYLYRHCGMGLAEATHWVTSRRNCDPWVSLIPQAQWGDDPGAAVIGAQ